MNIVYRRRIATLTAAALTAFGAAVAVAPPASAADITAITPMVVSNTQSRSLTIQVDGASSGSNGTLILARSDAPAETITKSVVRSDTDTYTTGSANPLVSPNINFATANDSQPANPGQYDATLTTNDAQAEPPSPETTYTCTRCFTVDAPSLFATAAGVIPSSVPAGATQTVTINGSGFAQGTTVIALPKAGDIFTSADPADQITFSHMRATTTQLQTAVRVGDRVAPGKRTLRLTNTNGNQFDCIDCFTVTGPELTGVFPGSAANDGVKTIRFTAAQGVVLTTGSTMRLQYVFGGRRNAALDIAGTGATLNAARTEITGQFDLIGAAPNREAYQPVVVRPDGSGSSCTCRFSVLQGPPPAPTAVSPSTVPANSTRTLTVTGTGFARGASVSTAVNTPPSINAERIVVEKVDYASTTRLLVTVRVPSNAQMGTRDLTVTNTDGQSGTCEECFEVAGTEASPAPSANTPVAPGPTASASTSPRPSASASVSARPSASSTTSTAPSTADSRYRGLASPVRVLDTRNNNGIRRSGEIVLDLSQRLNDAEATAAVLNVTVTNPTARGFLVAYPNGNTKPGTSNVNFETNQTQANEVVVGLSSTKRVSLFVDSASAHVIVDLVGSFTRDTGTDTGRVVTNAPVRAFDSRTTATPRRTGEVVVDLSSRLPDGATDAILNVTVQGPGARGYVVVYPSGTTRPGTSNVNFERGQTQANEVVTRVGTGGNAGRVSLFIDSASSALIVDVVGAVVSSATGAQSFTALEQPVRALDTRSSNGARRSGEVTVAMPSSVPSGATGVILNVTATNGTRSGFVAVYPAGAANPGTSNVNFPTNLTQANEVTTRLGSNRSVTLFVGGSGTPAAHLIVDVVGYLTS